MAGRPRKPNILKTGDYTREKQIEMELIDEQLKDITKISDLKPPKWMKNKYAKSEFKRLVEELSKLDFLTELDINNLTGYCVAFANYRKATEELEGQPLTTNKQAQNGAIITVENPLIKIQLKYSEEMRRYASMLGLSIDSRMKIATLKIENAEEDPLLKALKGDDD